MIVTQSIRLPATARAVVLMVLLVGYPASAQIEPCGATYSPRESLACGEHPRGIATGDFNEDGHLDLVTANNNAGTFTLWLGTGGAAEPFHNRSNIPVGQFPFAIAVGDFDLDQNLDVVVSLHDSTRVVVRFGDGMGGFAPPTPCDEYTVGYNPVSIAVGEYSEIAHRLPYIAVSHSDSHGVSVLLGTGMRCPAFQSVVEYPTDRNPRSVAIKDFDGDEIEDFVTANIDDNTLTVWYGTTAGVFVNRTTIGVGEGSWPVSVVAGQFNSDMNVDLAVVQNGPNNVSIWQGTGVRGPGNFARYSVCPVSSGAIHVTVANVGGDASPDLIVTNRDNGTFTSLIGDHAEPCLFRNTLRYCFVGTLPVQAVAGDFGGGVLDDVAVACFIDNTVHVRMNIACPPDINCDCVVNSQDFFVFLELFFGGDADFNLDTTTNSQDFFDFLAAFFEGC